MMKRILTVACALVATIALSQTEQSGIPAKILAANGKEIAVFLQGMEGENITFQMYRSTKTQPVPFRLVTKLTFVSRFDAEGTTQLFNTGDYQGMVNKMTAELKPSLDEYWQYMAFENNLQDIFTLLMKAYLQLGDVSKAMEVSTILLQNKDAAVNGPAQSIAILAALGDGKVEQAEGMLDQVESVPGQMYLRACVERAKGQAKAAFQLTTELIAKYGNDLAWMPQTELLNAYLYWDMGMTNAAINTARQVKNIYANSSFSTDAGKAQTEWTQARDTAEAAAKAKADEEEAKRAAVRERAEERARGVGFNALDETSANEPEGVGMDNGTGDGREPADD